MFCLFMDVDKKYYKEKLPIYFPLTSGGKPADTNRKGSQKGAAAKDTRSQSAEGKSVGVFTAIARQLHLTTLLNYVSRWLAALVHRCGLLGD